MALPATENFSGANAFLSDPPWTTRISAPLAYDGSGFCAGFNGSDAVAAWNADAFPDDQYSQVVVTTSVLFPTTDYVELLVRSTFVSRIMTDGYQFYCDGVNDAGIIARVAGTDTVIATASGLTYAPSDVFRLDVSGTTLTVFKNTVSVLSVVDASIASGSAGLGIFTSSLTMLLDDWIGDASAGGGPPPGTHIVSGSGSFAIDPATAWLSTALDIGTNPFSIGNANPTNYFHVGQLSWGTANGAVRSYPINRLLDLVNIPLGMDTLWYELAAGVSATIVELTAP